MTAHGHRKPVAGCYRCELNEDEVRAQVLENAMSAPCVVVFTRGQLSMVQAALIDAEERFAAQPDDEFPMPWIRAARARAEAALEGMPSV